MIIRATEEMAELVEMCEERLAVDMAYLQVLIVSDSVSHS
jgi:hypothetical protein